ncbi:MAG: hypothetical protein A2X25_15465 [Chloroflexi bacterium GWB2_49_20]|nr:MAG: hypothetical protein A2X25_15465 [Chloroflexi bacterium GWB2_49_20]OGN77465.1 MAG: hypothetical protein A2X26_13695 [Chloroflexi bacterium GWC2_49_37]OGN84831.1 MAG: hypothetical protein A2X27_14755 [Chloroflexi bacterium GWD2_49_16]
MDKARNTQIKNIETKTGKTLDELTLLIQNSGLTQHGQIRDFLIQEFKLGYGDANMLVHYALQSDGQSAAGASGASLQEITSQIFAGKTETQRQIHDRVMLEVEKFGKFEIAPKKTYLSLRRKRQFAMLGPASKNRVEVGLNMKGLAGTDRLVLLPAGGMCQYKVFLNNPNQVDAELLGWLRQAYDSAG